MLKTIQISNFELHFIKNESEQYDVTLTYIPRSPDEEVFGAYFVTIQLPYNSGLVDTSITDKNYFCTILYDDSVSNRAQRPNILFSFFTKKVNDTAYEVPTQAAKMTQILDQTIKNDFTVLSKSNSRLVMGENLVEIASGETKFSVSDKQITMACDVVGDKLHESSLFGILRGKGIFNFLPQNFLPGLTLPNYIPDIFFVLLVAQKVGAIKNLLETLNKKG